MKNVSGWIILDKASGLYSRTAGGRVARMLNVKKFGHIGTLDPMATGVLAIAFGNATKMIPFAEDTSPDTKEYLFSMQFGVATDTLDATGHVVARNDVIPDVKTINDILPQFIGEIDQVPPAFSAVHVDGRRAYELARRGTNVQMPPRRVRIDALDLIDVVSGAWNFRMRCGRGTYVRSVARDIAAAAGAIATVTMIRRVRSGAFDIKNAVTLDFLENMFNNGDDIRKYLMPTDYGLGDIPVLGLDDGAAVRYRNGNPVNITAANGLKRVYAGDEFVGIGAVENSILWPKRTI